MSSGHGHKDVKESGIDDQKPEFARGRWCYDTPGVMHPDQVLNIDCVSLKSRELSHNTCCFNFLDFEYSYHRGAHKGYTQNCHYSKIFHSETWKIAISCRFRSS